MSAGGMLRGMTGLPFLLMSQASQAAVMPPPDVPEYSDVNPTQSEVPVNKVQMGSLSVIFEHTTLSQIVRTVGSGIIQHRGDAGGSLYWICYTISLPKQSQRVWIMSGELGGSDHTVDSAIQISLEKTTKTGANAYCPKLPLQFQPISFGNRLVLGASEKDLIYWFGRPSSQKKNWLFYEGEKNTKDWSTLGTFAAKMNKGKAITISASRITTN